MIKFDAYFKSSLNSLREILLDNHFDLLVREIKLPMTYFQEPGFIFYGHSIERLLSQLTIKQQLLIRLFALKQSLDRDQLTKELLLPELLDGLINLGLLLDENGKVRTDEYGIVPYLGCFFIATIGTARSIGAYLGRQSYILATTLFNERHETLLDLGSGCGVLAILAARHGSRTIGIDILPEAVEVSRANAVLNAVSDRVEFFCGDLFQPVGNKKFSAILANTPFAALPDKYQGMVAVASGEEGLSFLSPVIEGVYKHEPEIVRLIANGLGNENQPALLNILNAQDLADRGYQARLYIYSKGYLDNNFIGGVARMVEGAYRDRGEPIDGAEILQDIKQLYRSRGFDYFYGIILELVRQPSGLTGATQIEQIDIANRYKLNMTPFFRSPMEVNESSNWLAKLDSTVLSLNNNEKEYLSSFKEGAGHYDLSQSEKLDLHSRLARVFGVTE